LSLIGKALALRSQARPPVPMNTPGPGPYRTFQTGASVDEANMRAYGTQGTVHSNVGLLASSGAKPPWKLYRKAPADNRVRYSTTDTGSDQRTEVVQHQALAVLNAPALPFWTRFLLFEISGIWLETTGKSHWVVSYDDRVTFPMGLWPVRPDRMTPLPSADSYLAGWIYTSPDGREKIPLSVRDVIYNRYPDPLDTYGGTGPIQSVMTDIDSARFGAEWNRNFFQNSATPGGVIQADSGLDDDDFDRIRDRWLESHRGVNRAHRVAVLEGGLTWVPNSMSVRDMDFANLRTTGRDVIREALGMHKVMTGVTDDVNRANAQTGEEVFASWKIVPRLDRWKDVLNYQFLPLFYPDGADVPVEFDYSFPMPLNREQDNAELAAKATAAMNLASAGVWDPDDILTVVGLPPMDTITPEAVPDTSPAAPPAGQNAGSDPLAGGDAAAALRRMAAWNALEVAR